MAEKHKIEYRVRKVTLMNKMCPSCRGTGKKEQKIAPGQFKTVNCTHCINGKAQIEHITEISLAAALNEMGIYKMIENTVNEIIEKKNVSSNS